MVVVGALTAAAAAAATAGVLAPPGPARMGLLVAALFLAFKAAALPRCGLPRTVAYIFLWPGLDPRPFEAAPGDSRFRAPNPSRSSAACLRLTMGFALVATAPAVGGPLTRGWFVIAGALLAAHLGVFDLLAAAWQRGGVSVARLCPEPWRARSLGEFWGRRWNRAFHDFARERIHRPLARRWGREAAVAAVFAFSGAAHELVLSVPAGAGFGGPTAYFLLHGLLVLLERRGAVPTSRWATAAAVVLPLPLLFHTPFVERVVLSLVTP